MRDTFWLWLVQASGETKWGSGGQEAPPEVYVDAQLSQVSSYLAIKF